MDSTSTTTPYHRPRPLDIHRYFNPDGTPNLKHAIDHGIYDLAPGFGLAGRTSHFTWQLLIRGSHILPKVAVKASKSAARPIQGSTISVGVEIKPNSAQTGNTGNHGAHHTRLLK